MIGGFAFLYVPLLTMVLFSFNASRLQTVWGGFSTRWYWELVQDPEVIQAAILTVKIAGLSATIATVIGVLSAFALARFQRFGGRGGFSLMVTAPLVVPEVVIGFSSLMLFIYMAEFIGWPARRGFTTITLVHATFATAFVTILVQSRLAGTAREAEDAAADLGARPMAVFLEITIPSILPAVISGWLLAFTLSIDDVVLATFTTGPGSTTLPIYIWSKVKFGVTPEINALASVMIGVVALAALVAALLMSRSRKSIE
ncbi:MAG: ABC transporter permease subunit [Pseudomonadota bacterium]